MPRLKDRSKQIPNGLTFYEPSLKWRPAPYSSLGTIVQGLIQVRRANPYLAKKNGWSVDPTVVTDEVDRYNAAICKAHGWNQYITTEGDSPPKDWPRRSMMTTLSQGVTNAAVGANIIREWLGEGGKPVAQELSDQRAHTCATCPQNKRDADWTTWFTAPAAAGIRRMLEMREKMKLTTPEDGMLNVCDACGCPLKLKVHTPLAHITKNMPPYQRELLDPRCWVLHES